MLANLFYILLLTTFFGNVISTNFVKVKGEVVTTEDGNRFPRPGVIMRCAGVCQRLRGCACLRVSNDGKDECQTFVPGKEANGLNDTGFVYLAVDNFNETFNAPSIASRKPCTQSSVSFDNGIKYSCDRALDGMSSHSGLIAPYFTMTSDQPADPFPWWQVDLKKEHTINAVTIMSTNTSVHLIHDFEIRVGNIPITNEFNKQIFNKNSLCARFDGKGLGDGKNMTFVCKPCPAQGRYLTIQIIKNCNDCPKPNVNVLNLSEVDVHGYLIE